MERGSMGEGEKGKDAPALRPPAFSPLHLPRYLVGTSGWHYRHWRDVFYPCGLAAKAWLSYYAERFPTVEVNSSFYRLPSESTMRSWREQTPPGFVFALKASRQITHFKRLLHAAEAVERFLVRARLLGERLGPVLFQLPPDMARDDQRLEDFLALLPADVAPAVEFRHPSWLADDVFRLLERRRTALCIVDAPGFAVPLTVTAPFVYLRLHGPAGMYAGLYAQEHLQRWAQRLQSVAGRVDAVFAYFNNDEQGYAVRNAAQLLREVCAEPYTRFHGDCTDGDGRSVSTRCLPWRAGQETDPTDQGQ